MNVVIGMMGVLATLVIAFVVYKFNLTVHRFNRINTTQNALNTLKDGIKDPDEILTTKFGVKRNGPIPLSEIEEAQKADGKTYGYILKFLNEYEAFALGANEGIYDKKYARKARGKAVVDTYDRYKKFILWWRGKYSQDPKAWEQLGTLAEHWQTD